jgi:hypothetical protein
MSLSHRRMVRWEGESAYDQAATVMRALVCSPRVEDGTDQ